MDSEIIEETEIQRIPLTQEVPKSKVKYAWAILFLNDINERRPFMVFKLTKFLNTNFPWKAFEGEMSIALRIKEFEFTCMPNQKFFIFAKIQYGKVVHYLDSLDFTIV